jgi:hypothetical protein
MSFKHVIEWNREHLAYYAETPLTGGYIHGRGGNQSGHCEDYCETLIKDDDLVTYVKPLGRECKTIGDVIEALQKEAGEYRRSMNVLDQIISELSACDKSAMLTDRYAKRTE